MFSSFSLKDVRYMQYISATIAAMSACGASMYTSWASPALPKLMVSSEKSPLGIEITGEEASWLVSSVALGMLFGACVKTICSELIGRKVWLLFCGTFLTVPWIVIYFSKILVPLYIARFIGGLGFAVAFTTTPIYIAEIAEKDIRGKLATSVGILSLSGNLFIMLVGPFLSYFHLALFCGIVPVTFLILFVSMPESPYYLVQVGRKEDALNVLKILSNKSADTIFLNKRLAEIEETVEYDMKNRSNIWEFISKKDYRRSLFIMMGVKGMVHASGLSVLDSYSQRIISRTHTIIPLELSSILFGVIQVPAAIIASFLVDNVGRRPLWITSAVGCAIAMFGEGLYFYLNITENFTWLPTACIVLFYLMNPIGISTLSHILLGEIFPTNIKGAAVSSAYVYSAVLGFTCLKYFEPISIAFGMHVPFWIFAGFCISSAIFIYFVLPETKGKSLEEIQMILNKNRRTGMQLNDKIGN